MIAVSALISHVAVSIPYTYVDFRMVEGGVSDGALRKSTARARTAGWTFMEMEATHGEVWNDPEAVATVLLDRVEATSYRGRMVNERFSKEADPVKAVMHPHRRHWLARRLTGLGVNLLLVLAGAGCVTSNAPVGFLPTVPEVLTDPFGAWVEVDTSEAGPVLVGGELLAVDDDSLYVLPEGSIRVRGISRDEIRRVRLIWFDSKWGRHSVWTLLGSLSTASHGFGLVFSLPVWTLTGIGISAERSRDPIVTYPGVAWSDLSRYARYPQGIPNGVDLLRPRNSR